MSSNPCRALTEEDLHETRKLHRPVEQLVPRPPLFICSPHPTLNKIHAMAKGGFPIHGVIGVGLVIISWTLNWTLTGFRTHALFFPLWLGYILTIDGIVDWRQGHSLLTRSRWRFLWLFALSIPVWWLFEALNLRTRNWAYVGSRELHGFAYAFWASLNFSTVIPAVFVTAEALALTRLNRIGDLASSSQSPKPFSPAPYLMVGALMLAALLAFPEYAFPFMWLSLFFLIDPWNAIAERPSLLRQMASGRWRQAVILSLAALICGFFWELWNEYSDPKWVYRIPHLGFAKIFEMPILGYGGYIPFAWELYALYQLVRPCINAPQLGWDAREQ